MRESLPPHHPAFLRAWVTMASESFRASKCPFYVAVAWYPRKELGMHWRATANDRAQGLIEEVASYNSKILLLMAQRRWPLGKIVMQPLYSTTIMQSTAASASVRRSDWMTNSPTHSLSRPLFKRCVRGGRGMARRGAAAKHRSFAHAHCPAQSPTAQVTLARKFGSGFLFSK